MEYIGDTGAPRWSQRFFSLLNGGNSFQLHPLVSTARYAKHRAQVKRRKNIIRLLSIVVGVKSTVPENTQ